MVKAGITLGYGTQARIGTNKEIKVAIIDNVIGSKDSLIIPLGYRTALGCSVQHVW